MKSDSFLERLAAMPHGELVAFMDAFNAASAEDIKAARIAAAQAAVVAAAERLRDSKFGAELSEIAVAVDALRKVRGA